MRLALGASVGLLLLLPGTATPQIAPTPRDPALERVGREGGPPSEVITAAYRDRAGFLWLGARDGLTRYDGYTFLRFQHDPADPGSLSENSIRTIFEDRAGRLWVGTNAGGLNRLDRGTGRFEAFRHDSTDPGSISDDSVYAIAEDGDGALWVATQRGLNRLEPRGWRFERIGPGSGALASDYVSCLLLDRRGRLWAGLMQGGLALVGGKGVPARSFRHDDRDPGSLGGESVFSLHEDRAGRLWVGTNKGLDRFEEEAGTFRHALRERGPTSVFAIADGPGETLWVGTMGDGLIQIEPRTDRVLRALRHDRERGDSLGDDRIMSLVADDVGSLWVGMWGGGLQRLTSAALLLAGAPGALLPPADLADTDVTALAGDARGRVWVGLRSGTLLVRDPGPRGERRFHLPEGDMLLRVLATRAGRILVGSAERVLVLDPVTGRTSRVQHDPADPSSLGPGYVSALLEDREGRIWVGTGEGGLQRLDASGAVAERHLHDPRDAASLSENYVTAILEDRRGTLWVGTRSGGLNALDRRTGRAVRYRPELVTSLLEDARGRIWVGTGGGGLGRIEPGADGGPRITYYTSADGLVDDNVMALLADDDGSLWLSTKGGLSRFDPETRAFASVFASDGLRSVEFEPGSAVRTRDTLYFGSVRWMVALPAGTPFARPPASAMALASLTTSEGATRADRPLALDVGELSLPYGRWLSMELAVLDFGAENRRAYAYRLRADAPWVDLGPRRSLTFTSLDPGQYQILARGRNSQGVWSELSAPVRVRVIPPFYRTAWFRALIALAAVAAGLVVHAVRTASLTRRNRALLELHAQREKARAELGAAYDRLRLLAQRLEAAKEEERKHIARELHDDLGPSLTAVIINLQLVGDGSDRERLAQRIADSTDLVDRMIQRIRDLSLDLRPPLIDELGLVPALTGYVEAQAGRAGLGIEVRADGVPRLAPELEIAAFRIAQEAVTNAIRHAEARRVVVRVACGGARLALTVEDDGKGFDVAASRDPTASGRALGLLGMEERARTLGGELILDSQPGAGTRVTVSLPLREGA